jgi:nitrogen regulatory protein PII
MDDYKFSLIIAIVNKGFADVVMEAAKSEGAKGGTILKARGTGEKEAVKFMGITIEPEKDLVMILTEKERRQYIMKAIHNKAGLNSEGSGLAFALPVEDVIGTFNLVKDN